jgi:hypothetical protein
VLAIEELVKELHNFEGSLKSVTINLGVPQTNEKPFTMPQVMFVLQAMMTTRISMTIITKHPQKRLLSPLF